MSLNRDNSIYVAVIAFVIIGLSIAFIFQASKQDDTIIISSSGSGESTQCINMANQYQIVVNSTAGDCYIRSLANGTGITLSTNATHIIINSTSGGSTVCTNLGSIGEAIEVDNCQFKKLLAGTGISLSSNGTRITITNTLPEATVCNNIGTGNAIIHVIGTNCTARSLIAGDGVDITNTVDDYTFTSSCDNIGSGEAVCETGNDINSLIAGTGITITDTTGDLTITNTVTDTNSCTNTGTGEAICESANNINSLIAGDGISITDTTGDLTVSNTGSILLCSDTITAGDTSSVCTLSTSKTFLHLTAILSTQTNTFGFGIQLNGDTSTTYATTKSSDGGADVTTTNQGNAIISASYASGSRIIIDCEIYNTANIEKVGRCHVSQSINVDTTAPHRDEAVFMWDNASNAITSITLMRNSGTGTLTSNGLVVVYGHD